MRKPMAVSVALFLATLIHSQESPQHAPKWTIPFGKYSVSESFHGKPAAPILSTNNARSFRTRLRDAAKHGPNFAGHYTIAQWGCGSGCMSFAIIDVVTGRVYWPPFSPDIVGIPWLGTTSGRGYWGLDYQLNSRLFIVDGCPAEEEKTCGTYYFEWTNNTLKRLRFDSVPQKKD